MNTFDVYKLWAIEPERALGCRVWDKNGIEYLDLYGGHAVISVGHCHPVYVDILCKQANTLVFYSNSVENPLQAEVAELLGRLSGYEDYSLFFCNSGAEANENALKLASFHTGKAKILAFEGAFHGRTSGAVAVTDNPKIISPFNGVHKVTFVPLNDIEAVKSELSSGEYAAVILEGIQGVSGIYLPDDDFLKALREVTQKEGVVLILDEIQSGYGRSGKFFAHQYSGIKPDIITTAKGMGNGFPIGGTLISPMFKPVSGMLGTTFGGNHLACAAAKAVLQIIESENLIDNAFQMDEYLITKLKELSVKYGKEVIQDIRGKGLIIGIDMAEKYIPVRNNLLHEDKIFTGGAKSNIIRILPPLTINREDLDIFINRFERQIERIRKN